MSTDESSIPPPSTAAKSVSASRPQRVDSVALFGLSRELIIDHNGREYRLRLTQNDKLILTA